jgi:large subunit ribosomal protein L6
MSRIGRKPIEIPKGVTVTIAQGKVTTKGPKGELRRRMPPGLGVKVDGQKLIVERAGGGPEIHGLGRALLNNMVQGVSRGFSRALEINGVGYRAEVQGKAIAFTLGFSHPVSYPLPEGIKASLEKNVLTLEGPDRELLGETAARIRRLRGPEPYKGKGVKYVEEVIERKVGKTGAT